MKTKMKAALRGLCFQNKNQNQIGYKNENENKFAFNEWIWYNRGLVLLEVKFLEALRWRAKILSRPQAKVK